ncbi:metallopeptidase family protein [Arthrobacter sp. A5]|uniref:metallopeptidase family protein n=1 Tax=Arthrobacter sp. A5 TaxID=576926 RepID=UPI003DAA0639
MQFESSGAGFTVVFDAVMSDGTVISPAAPGSEPTPRGRAFQARRRNRHDRGLRGELMLPALPGSLTRAEKFNELLMDSAERLSELWGDALDAVEFAVEDIPGSLESLTGTGERVPMAFFRPAAADTPAVITIYRRPVEQLADNQDELREIVHEVVIEQVAGLLNLSPDAVDPAYRRFRRY